MEQLTWTNLQWGLFLTWRFWLNDKSGTPEAELKAFEPRLKFIKFGHWNTLYLHRLSKIWTLFYFRISINCTSRRSFPAPSLYWSLNGKMVNTYFFCSGLRILGHYVKTRLWLSITIWPIKHDVLAFFPNAFLSALTFWINKSVIE